MPGAFGIREAKECWACEDSTVAIEVHRLVRAKAARARFLKLLLEERFPRIWVPTEAERDLRQLLLDQHHRLRLRTKVKNQLQALALNQGVQKGRRLWSSEYWKQLQDLPMLEHAARRRDQLLKLLTELDRQILALDVVVRREAEGRDGARRLMTHPEVQLQTPLGMG